MNEHIEIAAQEVRSAVNRMVALFRNDPERCLAEVPDMLEYGHLLADCAAYWRDKLKKAA